ncbi:hypothetical protein MUGA111182_13670 [Mucilaginibacter galii]|uniref:Uncharacterized protein n=2 Tax=Mucilaginibacter galii TaxID=2005073 RepID=A0A917MZW0_9SPHI|nr:hypothetical protein GCM10011425_04000 [Mucilaginibacter galii]
MIKVLKFLPFALLYIITACNTKGQNISVTDLLDQNVQEVLKSKGIKFKLTPLNDMPNYMLNLYGEIIPAGTVTVLSPEYQIDWQGEKIVPMLVFGDVPLKSPYFLLDKNGKILIITAEAGNNGPKGHKQGEVFADDDVINLKAALAKQWGKEKLARKDPNEGNIYLWKSQTISSRLTIENENFENLSKELRNDIPQDGRRGVLTIYNGVKPAFYDEDANYFNKMQVPK